MLNRLSVSYHQLNFYFVDQLYQMKTIT